MTVTSIAYLLFLLVGAAAYYLVPKRTQWAVLLALSLLFYGLVATPYTFVWILISALLAYGSTNLMAAPRFAADEKGKRALAWLTVAAILGNIALWFVLKGSSFWITGAMLLHRLIPAIAVPESLSVAGAMGMGYYTAQIIAYIMDCYWGICVPQKNFAKVLLLTCFFPQMLGGPISRFHQFETVYGEHGFSYDNFCRGSQRILWGFFKKMVISDRLGVIINGIWAQPELGGPWIWLAVFLYPLQIYTDFSGLLDIVLGSAEIFDIRLPENFRNPFFARTVQEFWQRWHITLGTWAKDYVYYPVLKSRKLVQLGKWAKKRYSKRTAKLLPWSLGMAVLWFVMGFWHGSVQHIVGVSLWFFFILTTSELISPYTKKFNKKYNINESGLGWHLFQSIRTYVLYAIGVIWFSAANMRDAVAHFLRFLRAFGQLTPGYLRGGSFTLLGVTRFDLLLLLGCLMILFAGDLLREKYDYARNWVKAKPLALRWAIWIGLFLLVLIYGVYGENADSAGFIYQVF